MLASAGKILTVQLYGKALKPIKNNCKRDKLLMCKSHLRIKVKFTHVCGKSWPKMAVKSYKCENM